MKKKTILVTGGLGYIGSHTAVELICEGFDVVIVNNLSNSEKFILDRIEAITSVRHVLYEKDLNLIIPNDFFSFFLPEQANKKQHNIKKKAVMFNRIAHRKYIQFLINIL